MEEGNWHPFQLLGRGTCISHLFFADDLILFAKASADQTGAVKACLDDFCLALGEKVSLAKSKIFFSENVNRPSVVR